MQPSFLFLFFHLASQVIQLIQLRLIFFMARDPAKGYHQEESKRFGGIKGGHVNIEAGGRVLDFRPGNNPLLPNNKKPSGGFSINESIVGTVKQTSGRQSLFLFPKSNTLSCKN